MLVQMSQRLDLYFCVHKFTKVPISCIDIHVTSCQHVHLGAVSHMPNQVQKRDSEDSGFTAAETVEETNKFLCAIKDSLDLLHSTLHLRIIYGNITLKLPAQL